MGNKSRDYTVRLNPTRQRILEEMRNNPNVTGEQLALMIGIKKTAIENNISFLKKNGLVERVGSRKNGWWNVR
ncbi:MAG: winged helix-turn-helix transcriptional regulator [Lachnospiraceae bacterium]|nr:winged helix-turn-helix transcriptional regulator [Lachnospiraceae bacterium]